MVVEYKKLSSGLVVDTMQKGDASRFLFLICRFVNNKFNTSLENRAVPSKCDDDD